MFLAEDFSMHPANIPPLPEDAISIETWKLETRTFILMQCFFVDDTCSLIVLYYVTFLNIHIHIITPSQTHHVF